MHNCSQALNTKTTKDPESVNASWVCSVESINLSHCCHIFHVHCCFIYITESWFVVSIASVQCNMCSDNWVLYGPKVAFVCMRITLPHCYHYCLSAMDMLNFCQAYSVECVSKIKSNLSIIFNVIYEWDCVFHLTHFSFHDCENICTSSYYLHEIGHRNHCHAMLMFTYSTIHQNTTGSTGSRPRPSETVVSLQRRPKCDIIINFIDQTATAWLAI